MLPQNNILKKPPHNLEAEQALLASILIDERAIDKIVHLINSDDFYFPYNRIIYSKLMSLSDEKKPLDIVSLGARLTDENVLEKVGGWEYISSIINIIPNSANIAYYANIVKDKALLRRLIEKSSEISESAYNFSGEISELLDQAERNIFNIAEFRLKNDVRQIGGIIKDTIDMIETIYKRQEQLTGTPTGFADLDRFTNGLQKSDLIIIAGRPGMGKTAFALNVALNSVINYDKSAVVFSLEMSSGQLIQRLLSSEARIESQKLRNGKLNIEEWQKLAAVGSSLNEVKLFIDDTPAITVMEVRAKCRRIKKEHGLDMIVVDYLQLMSGGRSESREQQISEISRSLKALAKELDVPVIALSQLNRSVENRQDKRPVPSDLRESGAIEQDADIIIFLYRDEVYNKESKTPNLAEVIIAKHRNGPTGTVNLAFLKEYTKFENAYTYGV